MTTLSTPAPTAPTLVPLAKSERALARLTAQAATIDGNPEATPAQVEGTRLEADRIIAEVSLWLRSADRPARSVTRGRKVAKAASAIRCAMLDALPGAQAWANLRQAGMVQPCGASL